MKDDPIKNIGHYVLDKTIGEGTFGKVRLGIHLLTKEQVKNEKKTFNQVAIKILEKEKIKEQSDLERVSREINILKQMRHPNIIQLYEIVETPRCLYLIMEYIEGGELFDYIIKKIRVSDRDAAKFFLSLISGVKYIHKLNVVHRDLKPENLLLDQNLNIKIVDFGLSNIYQNGQLLKTACGSPCYAAPEMIAGKPYNGLSVDVWSSGVILYAMLCGYLPFEDPVISNLYKKIVGGEFLIPQFVNPYAKDLIQRILTVDPGKRISIDEIIQHPWMQTNLSTNQVSLIQGQVIGTDIFDFDENILEQMLNFNFNIEYAKLCLENNKHNHLTTTYFLLLKKFVQKNEIKQKLLKSQSPNNQQSKPINNTNQNLTKETKEIKEPQKETLVIREQSRPPPTLENKDEQAEAYAKARKRAISVSQEKHPENLFPPENQLLKDNIKKYNEEVSQEYYNEMAQSRSKENKTNNVNEDVLNEYKTNQMNCYSNRTQLQTIKTQSSTSSTSPQAKKQKTEIVKKFSKSPNFKYLKTQFQQFELPITPRVQSKTNNRSESSNSYKITKINDAPYHMHQLIHSSPVQIIQQLRKLFTKQKLKFSEQIQQKQLNQNNHVYKSKNHIVLGKINQDSNSNSQYLNLRYIFDEKTSENKYLHNELTIDINLTKLMEMESILILRCFLIKGNENEFKIIERIIYNTLE